MAITLVQSITGGGATLVLNSVVAGNALFLIDSYYRNASTGVGEAVPTDTNGTFLAASADVPSISLGQDVGVGIFYEANAAAGTHTVTPQANTTHNTALVEFSGMLTVGLPDVATSGKSSGTATSQATGTTGSTAQASELSIIAFAMAAGTGSANVGLTDPVANYITLQINQNDASSVATEHSYQILSSIGTQSATFNWTVSDAAQWWHAAIATFKATATAGNIAWVKG